MVDNNSDQLIGSTRGNRQGTTMKNYKEEK